MVCNICGKPIVGYGNNPYPICDTDEERCCDECNDAYVIPARLLMMCKVDKEPEVGDDIIIIKLAGEKSNNYSLRQGTIESIDDIGQLHGTWGGLAVIPTEDTFVIRKK